MGKISVPFDMDKNEFPKCEMCKENNLEMCEHLNWPSLQQRVAKCELFKMEMDGQQDKPNLDEVEARAEQVLQSLTEKYNRGL